jgi:hypothetical protein
MGTALALWASMACASLAQDLQRQADPEASLVEELIVRSRTPGPAWWKVSSAHGSVWVLGVPANLPKSVSWNDGPLKARLMASRTLILPSQARIGPLQALFFFIGHRRELRSSRPMEQTLPEPVALRFAADREALGQPAGRYAGWKPAVAGVILDADFRRGLKVDQGEPLNHIRQLARGLGAKESRPADYNGSEVLKALTSLSDHAHEECLGDAMAEVENGRDRMLAAAEGWADGDPRKALSVDRGYERCFAALPALSGLLTRSQADTATAIGKAASQTDGAVAVVELRQLLARGGVLDRLRAQGFSVTAPDRS